ncbi:hypothetical protein Agau_P200050 (plasmid) [Agrobacterium tumefaciens F2]|nr:hypothetical protein Agau_P200050 [Agrobacterium tumefaciens F2]
MIGLMGRRPQSASATWNSRLSLVWIGSQPTSPIEVVPATAKSSEPS